MLDSGAVSDTVPSGASRVLSLHRRRLRGRVNTPDNPHNPNSPNSTLMNIAHMIFTLIMTVITLITLIRTSTRLTPLICSEVCRYVCMYL